MSSLISVYAERFGADGWKPLSAELGPDWPELANLPDIDVSLVTDFQASLVGASHLVLPIAPGPRGLPSDLSEEVRAIHAKCSDDTFNESWLLLAELTGFDWDRTAQVMELSVERCWASMFADSPGLYPYGKVPHRPGEWPLLDRDSSVIVRWLQTYRELAGEQFIAVVEELARNFDPKKIRLVMWRF